METREARARVEDANVPGTTPDDLAKEQTASDRSQPLLEVMEKTLEAMQPMGEIIVNVLADGSLRVEGATFELKQLGERMSAVALKHKNQPVRIRAEGKVPYQRVVEVIDACQRAGIWNISFAKVATSENGDANEAVEPMDEQSRDTPAAAIKALLQAARERNARVFQNGFSKSFKASLKEHGEDLEDFGDFGNCTFISANKLDDTSAEVVVEASDGSKRRFTFPVILEDNEWKLNGVGSKP
jgi:biopolymer transport protein ExbD